MKRIVYIILLNVRRAGILSTLVFVPIALLEVGFSSHPTSQKLARDLALATAALSVFVTAFVFRPEDTAAMEMQAPLPKPLRLTVFETAALCWLTVGMIAESVVFIAGITLKDLDIAFLLTAVAGYAAIVLLFGGLTLLGVIAGRDSRVGLMIGLAACVWMLRYPNLIPIPEPKLFASLYEIAEGLENPLLWGAFRMAYALAGTLCCWLGVCWMRDTDRLLGGSARRRAVPANGRLNRRKAKWSRHFAFLSRPLSFPTFREAGLVAYEALISVIKGPISIVIVALGMFGVIVDLFHFHQIGFWSTLAEINTPNWLRWLLVFMLPFALAVTASSDRRTRVDQLMLSILSPRTYLGGKLLGVCGAVLLSTLIACLPGFVLPAFVALLGRPIYLAAYLGELFLGTLPMLAYTSATGVLTGMLVRRGHPLVLGGVMAFGNVALFVATGSSVLGNILFPGGLMAQWTISYLIARSGGSSAIFDPGEPLIVPFSYLVLPVLSAALQIVIMWFAASKIYERQATTA